MSSSDPRPGHRSGACPGPRPGGGRPLLHRRAFLLALAPTLALGACTIQPLYGSAPSGVAVATGLTHVSIEEVDTRVAQQVRNRLIFLLYGGAGEPTGPLYDMKLTVTSSESALGVTPVESAPAYSVTVSATYEVTDARHRRRGSAGNHPRQRHLRSRQSGVRQHPRQARRRGPRRE